MGGMGRCVVVCAFSISIVHICGWRWTWILDPLHTLIVWQKFKTIFSHRRTSITVPTEAGKKCAHTNTIAIKMLTIAIEHRDTLFRGKRSPLHRSTRSDRHQTRIEPHWIRYIRRIFIIFIWLLVFYHVLCTAYIVCGDLGSKRERLAIPFSSIELVILPQFRFFFHFSVTFFSLRFVLFCFQCAFFLGDFTIFKRRTFAIHVAEYK